MGHCYDDEYKDLWVEGYGGEPSKIGQRSRMKVCTVYIKLDQSFFFKVSCLCFTGIFLKLLLNLLICKISTCVQKSYKLF